MSFVTQISFELILIKTTLTHTSIYKFKLKAFSLILEYKHKNAIKKIIF